MKTLVKYFGLEVGP